MDGVSVLGLRPGWETDSIQHQNGTPSTGFTSPSLWALGENFRRLYLYNSPWVASIIGSLAGTSFYGPVAGHGLLSHEIELLRDHRKDLLPEVPHHIPGDIGVEIIPAGLMADHYVRVHRRKNGEEGNDKEGSEPAND